MPFLSLLSLRKADRIYTIASNPTATLVSACVASALGCAAMPCATVVPVPAPPVQSLVAFRASGQAAGPGYLCPGGRQVPPHCQEDGGDRPAAQDSSTVSSSPAKLAALECWRRLSRGLGRPTWAASGVAVKAAQGFRRAGSTIAGSAAGRSECHAL